MSPLLLVVSDDQTAIDLCQVGDAPTHVAWSLGDIVTLAQTICDDLGIPPTDADARDILQTVLEAATRKS